MSEPENIRKLIVEEAKRKAQRAYIVETEKVAALAKWAKKDTQRQYNQRLSGAEDKVSEELEAARRIFNKERTAKLRNLYARDKQCWQEELGQMGLAFVEM